MAGKRFLMAGGGTGGHVMPLLAVADRLRDRGHSPYFIGTRAGFEARLVPQRGYPLEFIDIGGFQGVGLLRKSKLLFQLPISIGQCAASIGRNHPAACFSIPSLFSVRIFLPAFFARIFCHFPATQQPESPCPPRLIAAS